MLLVVFETHESSVDRNMYVELIYTRYIMYYYGVSFLRIMFFSEGDQYNRNRSLVRTYQ